MKKFLFGMIAVLSVSLFLIGCPTDPEDGAAGAAGAAGAPGEAGADGPNNFNGKPSVQAIQSAVDSGAKIQLDNVEIQGGGTLDFKTADVTVYGTLASAATDPLYIVATSATLTFAEGANIAPGTGDFFFGTAEQVAKAKEGVTNVVEAVAALADATGTVTAVKDLTLTKDLDIPSGLTVYVYGTLTVGATDANPTKGYGAGIVAIGTVKVTDTNSAALSVATNVDVTKATILYEGGTPAVAITLPATLDGPAFKVTDEDGVLQVLGTTDFKGSVTANNGYVEFGAAVTKATITGSGRIRFKNGTTATAFTTAGSVISGSIIEFPNGFSTATSAPVELSGAVYIGDTALITFGHADGLLTLGTGSAVYAGTNKVLEATAKTVLTPEATAALTAGTKKLTLGTKPLTLTSGTLAVAEDATLDVGAQTLTVKGILDAKGAVTVGGTAGLVTLTKAKVTGDTATGATLVGTSNNGIVTLAATDVLALADTGTVAIAGTAKVVAGNTTFSGVGTWTASKSSADGDNITGVSITSAAAGATIAAVGTTGTGTLTASGTAPAITQAAAASNALTIGANTAIDLKGTIATPTTVGSIVLAETTTADQGGKLIFAAATSIVVVDSSDTPGTALAAAAGAFVTAGASGKITVSDFANVKVQPGTTTATKVAQITGGAAEGYLQAYGGTGGTSSGTINASTAAGN